MGRLKDIGDYCTTQGPGKANTYREAAAELSFTEEKLRAYAVLADGESGGNARTGRDLEMDFIYHYKCSGELNLDFSFKNSLVFFYKDSLCIH